MKIIIIHRTASINVPNNDDLKHYHYLYSRDKIINGFSKPEDNINCYDGVYAAHTGGLNTNSIGVALCGMLDFVYKTKKTDYPISKGTCELMFKHVALLAKNYDIPVDGEYVMTHYEVGQKVKENKIKRTPLTSQNLGKIDIIYLHAYPDIEIDKMGDFIRSKIKWYYEKSL